jgi:hypothetical protein
MHLSLIFIVICLLPFGQSRDKDTDRDRKMQKNLLAALEAPFAGKVLLEE